MKKARKGLWAVVAVLIAGVILGPVRSAQAASCVWTGAVNTDWATTGNWSGCQGDGSAPPVEGDSVSIGPSSNPPVVNSDATILGLTLSSGSSLTISTGATLSVNGAIATSAAGGATTAISNSGSLETTDSGGFSFSRSDSSKTANLTLSGAGTWTIAGAFTQGPSTKITLGGGNFELKGDLARAGTMDPGTSTITFNGGSTQSMTGDSHHNFHNLVVSNNTALRHTSGSAPVRVCGDFAVEAGSSFTQSSTSAFREVAFVDDTGCATSDLSGSGAFSFARLEIESSRTVDASNVSIAIIGPGSSETPSWTNDGTFTPGASTITFNGTSSQTIGGSSSTTFNGLTVNNPAGVTLANDATVNGVLTLTSGDLATGSNSLTLGSSATTSGNGDVVGSVKRSGLAAGTTYGFGNPNVSLTFDSGGAGSLPTEITVSLAKSAPGVLAAAVQRTYTVSPTGGAGYTATLRLRYLEGELNGLNEGVLELWRFDGTRWALQPVTGRDTSANWVQRAGVAEFSDWAMATSGAGSPTDVTLSSFTARAAPTEKTGLVVSVAAVGAVLTAFVALAAVDRNAKHRPK